MSCRERLFLNKLGFTVMVSTLWVRSKISSLRVLYEGLLYRSRRCSDPLNNLYVCLGEESFKS